MNVFFFNKNIYADTEKSAVFYSKMLTVFLIWW